MKFYDANHRFLMRIEDHKKTPRESPPPPPKMRVIHPQQRWNIQRKQQSWFQILPLDGAQEEGILANNIQRSNKENMHEKRKTTRLRPRKTPQHISTQNQLETLKIRHHINQAAKRWNFAQYKLQQEKANDRKQLYEANHLNLMNSNY